MLMNLPLGHNMFNIICYSHALEENHRMKQVKTVDEYISMFPDNVQNILEKVRQAIKESAPGAEEAISYRMPAFK